MKTEQITIKNKLGLHARAAAKLVGTASHFDAEVKLQKGTHEVNGKSIMGVMMLAAARGTELIIMTHGVDEVEAAESLVTLIEDRFGEKE